MFVCRQTGKPVGASACIPLSITERVRYRNLLQYISIRDAIDCMRLPLPPTYPPVTGSMMPSTFLNCFHISMSNRLAYLVGLDYPKDK